MLRYVIILQISIISSCCLHCKLQLIRSLVRAPALRLAFCETRAHRLPHYKRGRERKRRLIWLPRRLSVPSARNNTFLFPWLSSDLFCLGERGRGGGKEEERESVAPQQCGILSRPSLLASIPLKFGVSKEGKDERDKPKSCQRSRPCHTKPSVSLLNPQFPLKHFMKIIYCASQHPCSLQ